MRLPATHLPAPRGTGILIWSNFRVSFISIILSTYQASIRCLLMDFDELSRWLCDYTAIMHFLFIPLTLGLACDLEIIESVYVMSGRQIYRDMTRFWGQLFGIKCVLGVTTGLAMGFQFGTNR